MIITRRDYMLNKATFREYYGQFVTDGYIQRVVNYIGHDALVNSSDKHLNDIPLQKWDAITPPAGTTMKMKEAGDFLTLASCVCIAKEAGRQYIETFKTAKK